MISDPLEHQELVTDIPFHNGYRKCNSALQSVQILSMGKKIGIVTLEEGRKPPLQFSQYREAFKSVSQGQHKYTFQNEISAIPVSALARLNELRSQYSSPYPPSLRALNWPCRGSRGAIAYLESVCEFRCVPSHSTRLGLGTCAPVA